MNAYTIDQKSLRPILARLLFELLQQRHDNAEQFLYGTRLFADSLSDNSQLIAPAQLARFCTSG